MPSKVFLFILIQAVGFFVARAVFAETDPKFLSDVEIYKRCYVRMTRDIPRVTDPRLYKVRNGEETGVAACMELFNLAKLSATKGTLLSSDPLAKVVLKTFNDFHQGWFSNKTTDETGNLSLTTDLEEPGLYLTRAAFLTGAPYKSVVTLNTSLKGLRQREGAGQLLSNFQSQTFYGPYLNPIFGYYHSTTPVMSVVTYRSQMVQTGVDASKKPICEVRITPDLLLGYPVLAAEIKKTNCEPARAAFTPDPLAPIPDASLTQTGRLYGIAPAAAIYIGKNLPVATFGTGTPEAKWIASQLPSMNRDLNEHMGGGILGSQSFINFNANLGVNVIPLEDETINRRITAKAFETLMCHQLPTLTDADVKGEIDSTSPLTFKQQSTCLRCHSSIDQAAHTYRNIILARTSGIANQNTQTAGVPGKSASRLPAMSSESATSMWALQPPTGVLHYRENLSGTVHNVAVKNISELGAGFADSDDLYLCAAKRYYQFMTGVDVDLTRVATKPLDLTHQKLVRTLGANLKKDQSVSNLIHSILSSTHYKTRNYNTEVTQ